MHGSASVQPQRKNGKQPDLSTWEEFCRQTLTVPLTGRLELAGDTLSLLPDTLPDLSGLRVIRAGLTLGQLKKGRFEPDHALAMALRPGDVRQTLDLTADDPRTLAYLKGEAISGQPRALRLCAGDSGRLLHGLGQGFQGHCEEPLSQGASPPGVILKKLR